MPGQSSDNLFRSLQKGELAPIYYFYGAEDVLKDEAVRMILDKALDPSLRDFNFDQRSAAQLDAEDVHALCNTLPMLAERRVVLLREVEGWKRKTKGRSEFLRYLERPSPDTIVIMVQSSSEEAEDKELARGAVSIRFDPLSPDRALKWLLREAGRLGVDLEADAAEHLVRCTDADLGALSSELSKLASLPPGTRLTVEAVGELVGVRQGETLWDWRDAVFDGDTGRAARLLSPVLGQSGVSGVRLVTAVGTALVGIGIARAHYDRGARGGALGAAVMKTLLRIRPFGISYKEEADRWSRWAPQWSNARIRSALRAARDTDEGLKNTTVSDERGLLLDLILRMSVREGGKGGKGGKVDGIQSKLQTVARLVASIAFLPVLSAFPAFPVLPAQAQTDPRLVEAIRQAQEGGGDSARTRVRLLLASTSPTDTLYPQIIYTQAMVASDANEMRRQLQRVAVEYSSSSWADDALLRLVQLDYASGNLEGAARNLERIRLDYPGSTLLPQASYWAARTYFDQKAPEQACRWIAEGLGQSRGNVELENQLRYLDQRCAGVRANVALQNPGPPSAPAADSDTAAVPSGTASGPPGRSDTVTSPLTNAPTPPAPAARETTTAPPLPEPTPPAPHPRAEPTPPPTSTPPPAQPVRTAARFRIQITAVRAPVTAEALVAKLRRQGHSPVIVQEMGLYKVRIGDYATKPEAVAALPALKAKLGAGLFVVAEP
jgi:DNA polymerase-3 subunit delta